MHVVVCDFLPFVKRLLTNLYPEAQVEQLALSTPYALRHRTTPTALPAVGLGSHKVGVDLNMQLDVKEIGEVLRGVAPEVFEEMESAEKEREGGLAGLMQAGEGLAGVVVEAGEGVAVDTGVSVEGEVTDPEAGLVTVAEHVTVQVEEKGREKVVERTEQIPLHLTTKQD